MYLCSDRITVVPSTHKLTEGKCNLWRMQVNQATAIARYLGESFSKYPQCSRYDHIPATHNLLSKEMQ